MLRSCDTLEITQFRDIYVLLCCVCVLMVKYKMILGLIGCMFVEKCNITRAGVQQAGNTFFIHFLFHPQQQFHQLHLEEDETFSFLRLSSFFVCSFVC